MKEFGSDFHYIVPIAEAGKTLYDFYPRANLYADGRQALIHLYHTQGWGRLWLPEYFCYEVVDSLKQAGLDLRFYADYPGYDNDSQTLQSIQQHGCFKPTDAILRVNYFGTRSFRNPEQFSVAAVVEDHTHDLIGGWAINSHADWCIASLRKTLPIPEGGILWSPVGLRLPEQPDISEENERIASIRWEAMKLKTCYLAGGDIEKAAFRSGFVDTEAFFDTAEVCAIDETSREYLRSFNIQDWYIRKRENWELLSTIKRDGIRILQFEGYSCYPFSLILVFNDLGERDRVRKELLANQIYPAILWTVPSPTEGEVFCFSRGMLSIHCDARYSREDVFIMKSIIESTIRP